jgi:hypothetical protein
MNDYRFLILGIDSRLFCYILEMRSIIQLCKVEVPKCLLTMVINPPFLGNAVNIRELPPFSARVVSAKGEFKP